MHMLMLCNIQYAYIVCIIHLSKISVFNKSLVRWNMYKWGTFKTVANFLIHLSNYNEKLKKNKQINRFWLHFSCWLRLVFMNSTFRKHWKVVCMGAYQGGNHSYPNRTLLNVKVCQTWHRWSRCSWRNVIWWDRKGSFPQYEKCLENNNNKINTAFPPKRKW